MQSPESKPRSADVEVPAVGRRRIGLFPGTCGVLSRLVFTGQIADVPVLESHLGEVWNPFANLPVSMMRRFRAVQDAGMNPVRGPRLMLEIVQAGTSDPGTGKALRTIADLHARSQTVFRLPLFSRMARTSSEENSTPVEALPPGRYLIRTSLLGVESIRQHMTDLAFLGTGSNQYSQKDAVVGYGRLLILPDDYDGPVITSDVDQTFLDTKIDHRSGLMEALFERIEAKRPLPGMCEFYRCIYGGGAPLLFISASPSFFRRALEAVFEMHDVAHDGLALKNLFGPLSNIARKAFEVVAHIEDYLTQNLNEAVERSAKFLGSSYQSMLDQVAYKLTALLEQRLALPTRAREILIGDNTESDFFIFTLYQILLTGALAPGEIEDFCYHLRFHEREAITRDGARRIRELVDHNIAVHGPGSSVRGVWIHLARPEIGPEEMLRHIEDKLPPELRQPGQIVMPVAYENAFEAGLLALNEGLIKVGDAIAIGQAIAGKSLRDHIITVQDLKAIVDRFPFRDSTQKEQVQNGI